MSTGLERGSDRAGESARILAMRHCLRSMSDSDYLLYLLAYHAAPTLQGIKPAALVCPGAGKRDIERALAESLPLLRTGYGIEIADLRNRSGALLLLAYRPDLLQTALAGSEVTDLLEESGYDIPAANVQELLSRLRRKCAGTSFPHEIGVFLGYPADEVRRFMLEGGRQCTQRGCWGTYGDDSEMRTCSRRFRNAKLRAAELILSGIAPGEVAQALRMGA